MRESKASVGLQYLIHLVGCYQYFEDGLDLGIMAEDERDLTNMDHWNLYGFSYYVSQCARGLAEGPSGPYYKHLEGVRYLHDFRLLHGPHDGRAVQAHFGTLPEALPQD